MHIILKLILSKISKKQWPIDKEKFSLFAKPKIND